MTKLVNEGDTNVDQGDAYVDNTYKVEGDVDEASSDNNLYSGSGADTPKMLMTDSKSDSSDTESHSIKFLLKNSASHQVTQRMMIVLN